MSESRKFPYPWDGLEVFLDSAATNEVVLLAYGSLMSEPSAKLTLPIAEDAKFIPAIGYGVKRIFNYLLPEEAYKRHGEPVSETHVAALNVTHTAKHEDTVNGVLVRVEANNIDLLRQREIDYDLIQVATEYWDSRQKVTEPVFVLECKKTQNSILPHLNYLKICEDAARAVSDEFLSFFRTTTFLADQTPLADWEHLAND